MKRIEYAAQGTCSRMITVEVDDNDRVADVVFVGGCHGNTQGVAALVRGMDRREAIGRLRGIDCRGKGTSCPDQLACALAKLGE